MRVVCHSGLKGSDSGHYRCTLNFNKKALHVEHKLLVEGSEIHYSSFLLQGVPKKCPQVVEIG